MDGVAAKPDESEEHYKNLLASFLVGSFYPESRAKGDEGELWAINTSGKIDLTIARQVGKGKAITEEIGVLFEVKKPKNTAEMPTHDRLNVKALQQLLYYFLQERLTRNNVRIRHVVITNIHEWFLFDARLIEALFVRDRQLVKEFEDFEAGRLSYSKTEEFYKYAAAAAIERHLAALEYTYFDLRSWDADLDSEDEAAQKKLVDLYKVFAPEHLFGLPFANDSNSLDPKFYSELLHILGLREYKDKNKKVIDRLPVSERDRGAIIENTIVQLDRRKKLRNLPGVDLDQLTIKPQDSAQTIQAKQAYKEHLLYETALELTITWVNRILFSKLLEAQLLSYHRDAQSYQFLKGERIPNYGELSALFFEVLAVERDDRDETVTIFDVVPYLNSSLFELTKLEHLTLSIGDLRHSLTMRVFERTVLKDKRNNNKKRTGIIMPLAYLLEFLGAYDFGGEAIGHIREESRSLISASVWVNF
ncbi:MAG: hypothetical protein HC795_13135 [Coleofasciculaceae cyanobacterium RL_1_1]|nr:hypothetical protein [Coleofasciculaceae cyanobacterium RL_1_1]